VVFKLILIVNLMTLNMLSEVLPEGPKKAAIMTLRTLLNDLP
jgi:hypothetical protein